MSTSETIDSASPDETVQIARELLPRLPAGAVIALHGELGAGKTHFVQGLAAAMGVTQPVTSPTYTLVQEYVGDPSLVHIDLYRISDEGDAAMLGLDDLLDGEGVKAVEWAERATPILPPSTIHITLSHGASTSARTIEIVWPGES